MEHAGIDLGKRESQIAIITEAGELVEKRLRTERERLLGSTPGGGVSGPGPPGVELERDAAARANHQGGQREGPLAARGDRMAYSYEQEET